jgi:hypothetical protein
MSTADARLEAPAAARRRGGSLPALRRWNAALGGLHLAQGLLMLLLARGAASEHEPSQQIRGQQRGNDPERICAMEPPILAKASQH